MSRPPGVRTPTFGEGDGPGTDLVAVAYPDSDTVNGDGGTAFATTLTYNGAEYGDMVVIRAAGVFSSRPGGADFFSMQLLLNGVELGLTEPATVTQGLNGDPWRMEATLIPISSVASECQGLLLMPTTTTPLRGMVNAANIVVDGRSGTLSIVITWAAQNAITLRQFSAELLRAS